MCESSSLENKFEVGKEKCSISWLQDRSINPIYTPTLVQDSNETPPTRFLFLIYLE